MYNKVILVGNLTRDIELRYSQAGMGIAKTAIATSRKFTSNGEKKEEVCFVDITFFGRSAEVANQYLRKGSKILVEGRLNFEQWVDQNNQKRSKHSVTVETMQMLDSRADSQNLQNQAPSQGGYNAPQQQNNQANMGGYNNQNASYDAPSYQAPATQESSNSGYSQPSYNAPTAQPRTQPQERMPEPSVPVIDIDEDEIPF